MISQFYSHDLFFVNFPKFQFNLRKINLCIGCMKYLTSKSKILGFFTVYNPIYYVICCWRASCMTCKGLNERFTISACNDLISKRGNGILDSLEYYLMAEISKWKLLFTVYGCVNFVKPNVFKVLMPLNFIFGI